MAGAAVVVIAVIGVMVFVAAVLGLGDAECVVVVNLESVKGSEYLYLGKALIICFSFM